MCKQCLTNPVYEFTNRRTLCRKCFIKYFHKKVLYTIKKFSMIEKDDIIVLEDKKDFRNAVLKDILEMLSKKVPIKIVSSKSNIKGKKNKIKIALNSTIDCEADKIVHFLIKGNINMLKDSKPVYRSKIKPLYLLTDKEVILYAKLRNLKFKETKTKKDKISSFLDFLEEKHPEVKRAIINSFLKLSEKK